MGALFHDLIFTVLSISTDAEIRTLDGWVGSVNPSLGLILPGTKLIFFHSLFDLKVTCEQVLVLRISICKGYSSLLLDFSLTFSLIML